MDSFLKSQSAVFPSLPPLAAAKAGSNYHGQVPYVPPPPPGQARDIAVHHFNYVTSSDIASMRDSPCKLNAELTQPVLFLSIYLYG
jgi:hypothetical protein